MRAFRLAHLIGLPRRQPAAEAAPTAAPSKPRTASKPPAPVRSKLLDGTTFAHLRPAVERDELPTRLNSSTPPKRQVVTAEAILAAGRKARTPLGTDAPPMDDFTRKVIDAGKRRRGELP